VTASTTQTYRLVRSPHSKVETAIDSVSGKGLGVHHRLLRVSDDAVLATLRVGLVFAGEQGLAEPSARASAAIEQAVSAMSSRVAN